MVTPSYQVTCKKNELIASDIYEIIFAKPEGFTFKAGQFVLFEVPLVDNREDIETRSFSIGSTPSEDELLFVMKMKEGGRVSRWIMEVLEEGIEMTMKGPFGFFLLDEKTPKEYLFIGTSTGIAPFRSQAKEALEKGETRRIDLVYGVRAEEDLFWAEEFDALAKEYDNFFIHFALSNPTNEWKGHNGRVQTLVPQIVQDFSHKNVYVCGNPEMTKELKGLCLEWGVPKSDLHVEGYI